MLEKLISIVAEQLNVEEEEVRPETDFRKDLGADSLDLFELVSALEEEYDVEIPSEELEKLNTVQAVVDYLEENYGILIDRDKYDIFYSGFASNFMPDITVNLHEQ